MKPTLIQKTIFGLGICIVLGCGCAAPFRPTGWVCYEMRISDSQSIEYCSLRTLKTLDVDTGNTHPVSDPAETLRTDPFLAMDQ